MTTIQQPGMGHPTQHGALTEAIDSLERRQAATLGAVRTEIARLQRTKYVLFAMLENLAKTILTYMPLLWRIPNVITDWARQGCL
jgi:hypothetical protein